MRHYRLTPELGLYAWGGGDGDGTGTGDGGWGTDAQKGEGELRERWISSIGESIQENCNTVIFYKEYFKMP